MALGEDEDPEEGYSSHVDLILRGRKKGQKVDTWTSIYRLLFPGETVPDPGENETRPGRNKDGPLMGNRL